MKRKRLSIKRIFKKILKRTKENNKIIKDTKQSLLFGFVFISLNNMIYWAREIVLLNKK